MSYDIDAVRADFPALESGSAHFDGPGGTQTPRQVIDAIAGALGAPLSNRGTTTLGEQRAEQTVAQARAAIADLVGGDAGGVVFGRSATQLASSVLSDRTKLVAVTAASNLIGTKPPVADIASAAHAVGALVYVDGVHNTAHSRVGIQTMGADFYSCSPYKFLGPHLGALVADPALLATLVPDKLLPSTNEVPERFEFGTLPYEMLAGVAAAVDYLSTIGGSSNTGSTLAGASRPALLDDAFARLEEHEDALLAELEAGLAAMPAVSVHSRADHRTPTLLITLDGRDTEDAYQFLAARGVDAPSSNFYALEASRRLGLGDHGGLRVGLAPYTNADDIHRLLNGLTDFLAA